MKKRRLATIEGGMTIIVPEKINFKHPGAFAYTPRERLFFLRALPKTCNLLQLGPPYRPPSIKNGK